MDKGETQVFSPDKARTIVAKSGRTNTWIASQLGVSTDWFNKVLAGTAKPSLPIIKLLALKLECEEGDLLSDQEAAS